MSKFILHTGGALGADLAWENECSQYEVEIKSYSFEGHKSCSKTPIILSREELALAHPHLHKANETLKRCYPSSSAYVDNLLKRNYYQIKDSNYLFAIGRLENYNNESSNVEGGTAWAVQMAINLGINVNIFDQKLGKWLRWFLSGKRWINYPPGHIPLISPILIETEENCINFTGIGTRSLELNGLEAIKNFCELNFLKK